ncbi:kelch repeat-containing protein [Stigmatella hybrida]|uniref:kelch repeat-containing protein n=1 Tax=Stigmatella hybrida TaxID=394097 RepID=UPI0037D9C1CA
MHHLNPLLLALLCLCSSSCDNSTVERPGEPPATGSPEPEHPSEPSGTSLFLQVVDAAGNPIPGAAISTRGAVFPVDSSGHLLLENLSPGRFMARVDALGFTSSTAVVELLEGAHVGAQVKLLLRPPPISFQAEQGGIVQTEQVRVTIPPDAVVDALGQPVSGTVHVTINPIDPTVQLSAMPGPLEGSPSSGSERVSLESIFMAEVSLWSNDAPVQLAPGQSATLEFVLPESLSSQFQEGDSIPAWWFDLDAGFWREEGSGTLHSSQTQPGRLVWAVQVNHFTWWNCDAPWTDKSCVNVTVVDKMGVPISGAEVHSQGISYSGFSWASYTGSNGLTCIEIKRGSTANVYSGLAGQPGTAVVEIRGTQEAAVCGSGSCTEVNLVLPEVICAPGAHVSCSYTGPSETQGKGMCRAGRQQCNISGTAWSACQGEVLPAVESCRSPFDEDCDGEVDEHCGCSDRQGLPCYGGASWTNGVGICHGGALACDLFGNTICQGQQLPLPEIGSTPEDENCNGLSEGYGPDLSWGWRTTAYLTAYRRLQTATLLPSGQIFVVGGVHRYSEILSSAEMYDPTADVWSAAVPMSVPRSSHTATLLPNGQVLVTGGNSFRTSLSSAEVYDLATGRWSNTGSMSSPRVLHTATLLANGKVLIVGGNGNYGALSSSEVYDPATGAWSVSGSMAFPRASYTATLLPNGKVLVAGGADSSEPLSSAEVYDPVTGIWSVTGSMISPRSDHTATLLPDGKVLVTGGYDDSNSFAASSAEVYDPVTGVWSVTGSMAYSRSSHTATRLSNGQVLVAGGASDRGFLSSAEVYDLATGSWSTTESMDSLRHGHTATLLPNGQVLIVAGEGVTNQFSSAEVYGLGPVSGTWVSTGSMGAPRQYHTATLLPNGKVLVAGGHGNDAALSSSEVYDPVTGTWSATGSMALPRSSHTATLLPDGKVLVVGGAGGNFFLSAEIYDPAIGIWSAAGSMVSPHHPHTATLLPNGKVLVVGGSNGSSSSRASAELYDFATNTWSATGSTVSSHGYHTATLLPNGQVLVAGGGDSMSGNEIYDPDTGVWSTTDPMVLGRIYHTATLLPNGQVLVAGGSDTTGIYGLRRLLAEVYDTLTGTWRTTNSLASSRVDHTATLLPNGNVLIVGGYSSILESVSKAEVYISALGTWNSARSMALPRVYHTTTLLPDGRVLVCGGMGFDGNGSATAELYAY